MHFDIVLLLICLEEYRLYTRILMRLPRRAAVAPAKEIFHGDAERVGDQGEGLDGGSEPLPPSDPSVPEIAHPFDLRYRHFLFPTQSQDVSIESNVITSLR